MVQMLCGEPAAHVRLSKRSHDSCASFSSSSVDSKSFSYLQGPESPSEDGEVLSHRFTLTFAPTEQLIVQLQGRRDLT